MSIQYVLILGMHRSGTSCLTGCLEEFGLNLGAVSNQNKYNQKGNKEDKTIFRLNESVLNNSGGAWNNPPKSLKWDSTHETQQLDIIKEYSSIPNPIGIKDPRMLLTLPFWAEAFGEVPKMVGSIRNPKSVAKSLSSRGKNLNVEPQKGLALWYEYNKRLLKLQEKYHFPLVDFDLEVESYIEKVKDASNYLNLPNTKDNLTFFEDNLRNQKQVIEQENLYIPWKLRRLYKKLKNISK